MIEGRLPILIRKKCKTCGRGFITQPDLVTRKDVEAAALIHARTGCGQCGSKNKDLITGKLRKETIHELNQKQYRKIKEEVKF